MDIQSEVAKIHAQYGASEVANYRIQLLFEEYAKDLKSVLLLETISKLEEIKAGLAKAGIL